MAEYSFRALTPADEALFKGWLAEPHIDGWWGDGATEWALVAADFDNPAISMQLACVDGTPFAYVQDYDAFHWPMPQYSDAPEGARALDTFLGNPRFLGQGHGAGYLAARLAQLRPRHPRVLTDPDVKNTRAIRAYSRAGFRPHKIAPCEDGDPVQVMVFP